MDNKASNFMYLRKDDSGIQPSEDDSNYERIHSTKRWSITTKMRKMRIRCEWLPLRIMVGKHKRLQNTRDRISKLPDGVLTYILSFLSTKDVVKTSVLSRRWKPLWACVPTLDLSDSDFSPRDFYPRADAVKQRQRKFLAFIYEYLLRGDFSRLTRFRLSCSGTCDEPLVISWVDFAKKNNVQKLSIWTEASRQDRIFFIEFCKVDSSLQDGNGSYTGTLFLMTTDRFILESWMHVVTEWNTIELNLHLTYCKIQELPPCLPYGILVVLSLTSVFLNFPKASVWFPKLKTLYLISVKFGNGGLASDLINSSCPLLEELEMYGYGMEGIQNLTINSMTLKHLFLNREPAYEFYTIIDAPNLQYLCVIGCVEQYVFKDLSLLEKAALNLRGNDCLHHLRMIKNVKHLTLSYKAMLSLNGATIDLPMFKNLTHLTFGLQDEADGCITWDVMDAFLQKLPKLKAFLVGPFNMSSFKQDYELTLHHNVPRCLVSELEMIILDGFVITDMNLRFVEYILKYSKVLEVLLIAHEGYDINKVKGDIRAFPKASPACLIKFVWDLSRDSL